MSKSSYLSPNTSMTKPVKINKVFQSLVMAGMAIIVMLIFSVSGVTAGKKQEAEAVDWTQWIMCTKLYEPGQMIYQWTESADIPFLLRSKSASAGSGADVTRGLNWLLEVSGHDFKRVNQEIVGYSMEPEGTVESLTDEEYKERYNKGNYVNPFDRFGVAGLKFTNYMGEWKYLVVDACSIGDKPADPQAGIFYPERLEPRSTWDYRENTTDIRTEQFNKGIGSQFVNNTGNTIANWIFSISKTIVAITLAFINFAFTDITDIMGLNNLIGGEGGIFSALFDGVFMPLIIMVFAITGMQILWNVIANKQYRKSMSTLIRSLVLFIIAVVISGAPAFFIGIPNNVAVVTQSVILVGMNQSLTGGDDICATDIGQMSTEIVTDKTVDDIMILEQASKNIRSVVGCQLWQALLLKPWAEGQFGTEWNNTWANDKVPTWTKNKGTLANLNETEVGVAEVPLGAGKVINNWAIYQISTHTNMHSPTGMEGQRPKYSSGVANDWWRIVDATSNYGEVEKVDSILQTETEDVTITYDVPADNIPTAVWDSWAGNNIMHRIGTASSSVIVAGVGVAAPLLFSALSLMYTIGISILMAFAPIMLLMGCWADKGWEVFKGWGELVLNVTMKRIATGLMLTLSILFTSSILKMSNEMNWWQIIALLILVSVILIKTRTKITDALASFKFASTNFGGTASRLSNNMKKPIAPIKSVGKVGLSGVVGAYASKRSGGSITGGMTAGMTNELRNFGYRNELLRQTMTAYETEKADQASRTGDSSGDQLKHNSICVICGKTLDYENDDGIFHGGRDANGNLLCNECLMDNMDPDAEEVIFHRSTAKERMTEKMLQDKKQQKIYQTFKSKFSKKSSFDNKVTNNNLDAIELGVDNQGHAISYADRENRLVSVLRGIEMDIAEHARESDSHTDGAAGVGTVSIPDDIAPYVDRNSLGQAWEDKQYDYIRMTYIAAYVSYYQDVVGVQFEKKLDDVLAEIKTPESIEPDEQP